MSQLELEPTDGEACRHSLVGRGESEHGELISSYRRHLSLRSAATTATFPAIFPATVSSWFRLGLKERATTNEIKPKPAQTAAVDLLPNKSHATANII